MPYLPLDLDAKKQAALIAGHLGHHPGQILWGLAELWEQAWRSKKDVVPEYILDGCFAGLVTTKLHEALVAAGFIERVDAGWRVRGARRWLFAMEGRSRGGHAAKSNLIPGARQLLGKPVSAESPKQLLSAPAQKQPRSSPDPLSADDSALTSSIQHPASLKEDPPRVARRARDPGKVPNPRHAPMVKRLVESTPGYTFTKLEARPLSTLLGMATDEEIFARWRRAWGRTEFPLVRDLAALVSRWNYFADTGPPAEVRDIRKGTAHAEDFVGLHEKGFAF